MLDDHVGKRGAGLKKVTLALLAAIFAALLAAIPAFAIEGFSQAKSPGTNYPLWYEDSEGLRLELCVDGPPLCLEGLPNPNAAPLVAQNPANSNFPDEAFWWAGEAEMNLTGGGDALLVLAREAAFGGGDEAVRAGDEMSFSRVRIRATVPVAGATYRVTHPYGVDTFEDVPGGTRGINFTEDIGCALSSNPASPGCDFGDAFSGRVDPFLRWDPGVAPAPPAGHIGNPTVNHRVTGSPFGTNFFRMERTTDAQGNPIAPVELGETALFAVQGKVAGDAPPPPPPPPPPPDPPPPTERATLSVNDVRIVEGDRGTKNAVVRLTLSSAPGERVSLSFATANGTARAPSDYQARSGTRAWRAQGASLTRRIAVPIVGDRRVEPDETFRVNLSDVVGANAPDTSALVTIEDDRNG